MRVCPATCAVASSPPVSAIGTSLRMCWRPLPDDLSTRAGDDSYSVGFSVGPEHFRVMFARGHFPHFFASAQRDHLARSSRQHGRRAGRFRSFFARRFFSGFFSHLQFFGRRRTPHQAVALVDVAGPELVRGSCVHPLYRGYQPFGFSADRRVLLAEDQHVVRGEVGGDSLWFEERPFTFVFACRSVALARASVLSVFVSTFQSS